MNISGMSRTGFSALLQSAVVTQSYMYAPDTAKNIKSHLRTYVIFCTYFNRCLIPADTDTLVAFCEMLSLTCGYPHIKHILSSVKLLHRTYNVDFIEHDFRVDCALQSLRRKLLRVPLQVFPITPKVLLAIHSFMDMNDPEDQALWSSFLVAFFCMFRKKSLIPESVQKFDTKTGLSRRKITVHKEQNLALIYANFSKVIQYGQREIVLPIVGIPGSPLDPVTSLYNLFEKNPVAADCPAFSFLKNGKMGVITYPGFTKRLKKLLQLSGFNPALYSGHSFRRGGATFLYNCGADAVMIKACGDWGSDCFLNYVWLSLDQRLKSQQLMAGKILN